MVDNIFLCFFRIITSVSHDPSEIIRWCFFGKDSIYIIINVVQIILNIRIYINIFKLLNIFVETVI